MATDSRPIERQDSIVHGIPSNAESTAKEEGYCAYCGTDLDRAAAVPKRFGESFCSDAHADAFVDQARASRIEKAATPDATIGSPSAPASSRWDLRRLLKMGACCGLPLLALVFLAGGGGALLGAGAAVLPLLALLACPLGMFFMMRAMQGHGQSDKHTGADQPSQPKELKER